MTDPLRPARGIALAAIAILALLIPAPSMALPPAVASRIPASEFEDVRVSLPFPHHVRLAVDEDFRGHLTDASRSHRVGTQRIAPGSPAPIVSPFDKAPARPAISNSAGGRDVPVREKPAPSPSARAVPSVAPVRVAARTRPASTTKLSGVASTYGPGYAGYLALPAGPGIHVRICGAGGCIDRVSNDTGPVPSLHRVADLNVADFERVCGVPWTRGLCRVSLEPIP